MSFDFGKFMGSFGQSLMSMGGQGGGAQGGGMGQAAPLDLSFLAGMDQQEVADLLARYDRPRPSMQQHQNFLTGGF